MNNTTYIEVAIDKEDDMYEDLIKDLIKWVPKLKGRKGRYKDGKKHYSGHLTKEELDEFLLLTKMSPWGGSYEYGYYNGKKWIES